MLGGSFILIKMDDSNSGCMIKLNIINYSAWKTRMKDHLYYIDLVECVLKDKNKPSDISDEERVNM